jgi:hypothetical protein
MEKRIFHLINKEVKIRAMEFINQANENMICTIRPKTRSLEQNAKMWAMLNEISNQVIWYDNKLTSEEWKDVFSASLKKQKVVPGLDGGFVICGQSTSKMSKSELNEMIELITAFGTQKEVKFND